MIMSAALNVVVADVTARLIERSRPTREAYLARMADAASDRPQRTDLGCANIAHGFAACATDDKSDLRSSPKPNIAIVSAYNDMLSAHQPLEHYPDVIRAAVRDAGGVAQFAA